MRPTFEQMYLGLATLMSHRSTCSRLRVGCVITSADFRQVLAVGYNGNATGLKNGCDSEVVGACGCLHAEENAIINCNASRDTDKIVFVTNLPCPMCSKRLINLGGVKQVYYRDWYRVQSGLESLAQAGIKHAQMDLGDVICGVKTDLDSVACAILGQTSEGNWRGVGEFSGSVGVLSAKRRER